MVNADIVNMVAEIQDVLRKRKFHSNLTKKEKSILQVHEEKVDQVRAKKKKTPEDNAFLRADMLMEPLPEEEYKRWRELKRLARLGSADDDQLEELEIIQEDGFSTVDKEEEERPVSKVVTESNNFRTKTLGDDMSPARAAALHGKPAKKNVSSSQALDSEESDDEEDDGQLWVDTKKKKKRSPFIDDEAEEAEASEEEEEVEEEEEHDWSQYLDEDGIIDGVDTMQVLYPLDGPFVTGQLCRRAHEQIKAGAVAETLRFKFTQDITHLPTKKRMAAGKKIVEDKLREVFAKQRAEYRSEKGFIEWTDEDNDKLMERVKLEEDEAAGKRKNTRQDLKDGLAKGKTEPKIKAQAEDDEDAFDPVKRLAKRKRAMIIDDDDEPPKRKIRKEPLPDYEEYDCLTQIEAREARRDRQEYEQNQRERFNASIASSSEEESAEEKQLIDFSKVKSATDETPFTIDIGGGYKVKAHRIFFTAVNNGGGSFFGVSIIKTIPSDNPYWLKKNAKDPQINFPLRNLEGLHAALQDMRQKMNPVPTLAEFAKLAKESDGYCDLSGHGHVIPKVSYKIDELFYVKGERVKWGQAMVEAVVFERLSKDQKKKGYNLQVPARLFDSLCVAIEHLYTVKCQGE